MKKLIYILGFSLIFIVNIIIFSGVIYNRSKKPVFLIELTERELQMPYRKNDENSGLSLKLKWRTINNTKWFNEEKLKELSFEIKKYADRVEYKKYRKTSVPKKVFIVLEYDGKPYNEAVKNAEIKLEKEANAIKAGIENNNNDFNNAKKDLKDVKKHRTRLYAINVGFDADILREKYNEPGKFIIVPGTAKIRYNYIDDKKEAYGYVSGISVDNIHVPLQFRKTFDSLPKKNRSSRYKPIPPRYKVKLAYGKRFEPWIQSVQVFE